jgi:glycosyltransferase involved in cell wall biosynthesis
MPQRKLLLIVSGACDALGGTFVTLSLLIKGFMDQGRVDSIRVIASAGLALHYLQDAGQEGILKVVPGKHEENFLKNALNWVSQQPLDSSLLLDNCVERSLLPTLILASSKLRLSGRPIYYFCYDLAFSDNALGYWICKLAFGSLKPKALCNSNFTKHHIQPFMSDVAGGLYQRVDLEKFRLHLRSQIQPPPSLMAIIAFGASIMLMPSLMNLAGIVNNKNLRGLISVLAELKQRGASYHDVVIGEDRSPNQSNCKALIAEAERECLDIVDCFTVLPPTFEIAGLYQFDDVVVSLAPRGPFGRVVVEAIACCFSVVVRSIGGIGRTLSKVAPNLWIDCEFAQAILLVVTDPQTQGILQTARGWVEATCRVARYA